MNDFEIQKMATLEKNHWWYMNLRRLTRRVFDDMNISASEPILDVACGTGGCMEFLIENHYTHIIGFDQSDLAVSICKSKNLEVFKGDMTKLSEYFEPETFKVIICHDALYFLDETQRKQFFRQASQLLKNGGFLILNLPASPWFKGNHDKHVGISYRFKSSDLQKLSIETPLKLQDKRYWPFMLSPLILGYRLSQRLMPAKWTGKSSESDLKPVHPILNQILHHITLLELQLPHIPMLGSSLFSIFIKIKHETN